MFADTPSVAHVPPQSPQVAACPGVGHGREEGSRQEAKETCQKLKMMVLHTVTLLNFVKLISTE